MPTEPVLTRNGPYVVVDGPRGESYEVVRERMRSAKTGRRRRVWSARRVGALGWQLDSSLRSALARTAVVADGRRPVWLTAAVAKVETRYAEYDARREARR